MSWRDDETEEAEFDKGFYAFIRERGIKVYKRSESPKDKENDEKPNKT
jgi:hypothetical protein